MDKMIFAHAYMRRKYNKDNPPTTLADALEMALYDFSLAEADPKVEIWMGSWYDKHSNGTCNVCFAGAVMRSRNVEFFSHVKATPLTDTERKWENIFYALNELRVGRLNNVVHYHFGRTNLPSRKVTAYAVDPVRFRKDMQKLLADLRKEERKNEKIIMFTVVVRNIAGAILQTYYLQEARAKLGQTYSVTKSYTICKSLGQAGQCFEYGTKFKLLELTDEPTISGTKCSLGNWKVSIDGNVFVLSGIEREISSGNLVLVSDVLDAIKCECGGK